MSLTQVCKKRKHLFFNTALHAKFFFLLGFCHANLIWGNVNKNAIIDKMDFPSWKKKQQKLKFCFREVITIFLAWDNCCYFQLIIVEKLFKTVELKLGLDINLEMSIWMILSFQQI